MILNARRVDLPSRSIHRLCRVHYLLKAKAALADIELAQDLDVSQVHWSLLLHWNRCLKLRPYLLRKRLRRCIQCSQRVLGCLGVRAFFLLFSRGIWYLIFQELRQIVLLLFFILVLSVLLMKWVSLKVLNLKTEPSGKQSYLRPRGTSISLIARFHDKRLNLLSLWLG